MGYIYCITSPSGKKYIGQTIRDYTKRFREHCKLPGSCIMLENAIKKYGKDAMTFEIIEERPQQYQASGYAVVNHPTLSTKYFTSKKMSEEEKLNNALTYLQSA